MATATLPTRRRDHRGRYLRTYTIRYTHQVPGGIAHTHTHTERTAAEVERIGRLLLRQPEEETYNVAVLDRRGDDCTFDFACFQDDD